MRKLYIYKSIHGGLKNSHQSFRLYTQLEVLKNKSLRQDNPHISKRRGGRKPAHRRFSLQKKGSKEKVNVEFSN